MFVRRDDWVLMNQAGEQSGANNGGQDNGGQDNGGQGGQDNGGQQNTGGQDNGGQNQNNGGQNSGSGDGSPDAVLQALQKEDNRTYVKTKGFKSFDALVETNKELETRLGRSMVLPGETADPKEWDAVYDRLGRPKEPSTDANGYDFKLPKGVSETFAYSKDFAAEAAKEFHQLGLSKKQAQGVHDYFVKRTDSQFTANMKLLMEHEHKQHLEITKQWGDPGTDTYKKNTELATRAMVKLGLEDTFKRRGILGDDGEVREAPIAFALLEIGQRLYAEETIEGGDLAKGPNPWKKGDTWNETRQGQVFKKDPALARQFIKEAGLDPKTYGLSD